MSLIIEKPDGVKHSLVDYSTKIIEFQVDPPVPKHDREELEGRDGHEDLGTQYEGRTLRSSLLMEAIDELDYPLLRNELFKLFDTRLPFYLIDEEEPGKRWLVKTETFSLDRLNKKIGKASLNFKSKSAYAESIGTTLDPLTFDAELWQTGQGLTLDETMYTHSTTSFQIYNATDGVTINPRQMPLEITFKGASSNLTITNTTTGDVWQYTKTTASGDTLLLTGVRSLKNGLSVFSDTNHNLITLAPGYNNFTITGATGSFTISFAFRFYTL